MSKLKEFVEQWQDKEVHIVGFIGAEGSATLEFLLQQGFTNIVLHDSKNKKEAFHAFRETHKELSATELEQKFAEITSLSCTYCYGSDYLKDINKAEAIFVSQAWYKYASNDKLKVFQGKIPFFTMTNLYFALSPCKIIGVSGTNGKSSTAKLVSELFQHSHHKSYFAGNDRLNRQVLDRLKEMQEGEYLILEISNRQLMAVESSPNIALYTNVTPDHFDDHSSLEDYYKVKEKLATFQQENDLAILNYDDPVVMSYVKSSPSQKRYYSLHQDLKKQGLEGAYVKEKTVFYYKNGEETAIIPVDDIQLKGSHNIANCMAAIIAAFEEGVDLDVIRNVLKTHSGLRYRNQFVKTIQGIDYYNDLNSTVPEATIAAVNSFEEAEKVILIAGGEDKGLDYGKLGQFLVKKGIKQVIMLPGSGTDKMRDAIKIAETAMVHPSTEPVLSGAEGLRMTSLIEEKKSLDEAVSYAQSIGKEGDVVLLSPACAYFFSRYTKLVTEGDESWLNVLTAR